MAIRLEDKKQIVSEVNTAANSALSAVLADYRGVTVSDMTELRKSARDNKVYLRVVRNTLLKALSSNAFKKYWSVLQFSLSLKKIPAPRHACSRTLLKRKSILRSKHSLWVASYWMRVRSTGWRVCQRTIRHYPYL